MAVLIGTTRDEWKLFTMMDPSIAKLDDDGVARRLAGMVRDRSKASGVVAHYRRTRPDATVSDLKGRGLEVTGSVTDVADFKQVQKLADLAFKTYGKVHVCWNNAGTGGGGSFTDADMTGWNRAIGVNVQGTLHGILSFMPRMIAQDEEGYILGTTSGSGANGTMYTGAAYAATKNAVLSLMESLYGYLRDQGSKIRAGSHSGWR